MEVGDNMGVSVFFEASHNFFFLLLTKYGLYMKTGNLELDKNKYLFGFYGFEVQFHHHFYSGLEI